MNYQQKDSSGSLVPQSPINKIIFQVFETHQKDTIKDDIPLHTNTIENIRQKIEQQNGNNQTLNMFKTPYKLDKQQSKHEYYPNNTMPLKQINKEYYSNERFITSNKKKGSLLHEIQQFKSLIKDIKSSSRFLSEKPLPTKNSSQMCMRNPLNDVKNNIKQIRDRYITYKDFKSGKDLQKIASLNYKPFERNKARVSASEDVVIQRFQIIFNKNDSLRQ